MLSTDFHASPCGCNGIDGTCTDVFNNGVSIYMQLEADERLVFEGRIILG